MQHWRVSLQVPCMRSPFTPNLQAKADSKLYIPHPEERHKPRFEGCGPTGGLMVLPAMRSIVRRRRFAAPHHEVLKCGARALGRALFDRAVPRHRHDAQRGDAVALPPQYAETEAVEGETLAAFGDRARFVDHE